MSETESQQLAESTAPSNGKPLVKRLKVVGIISAIVFVQCIVAYLYFPSAESTAHASVKAESNPHEEAHHSAPEHEQTEVELGAFSITVFNPNSNGNLLIDFHLFGTVIGAPAE